MTASDHLRAGFQEGQKKHPYVYFMVEDRQLLFLPLSGGPMLELC